MSRTRKGNRPPGYDYGSRRLFGWPSPGPFTKKETHRKERIEAKKEIIDQMKEEDVMSTPEILKIACKEIEEILKKHDLAGIVTLASGNGNSEYLNHIVDQSWSAMSFENTPHGIGIRIRAMAKSAPPEERLMEKIKLQKTVNALVNFRDVLFMQFEMMQRLVEQIRKFVDFEEGPMTHNPRKD